MAAGLDEQRITCPWCGEPMQLLVDTSAGAQQYIEDCEICCRPMQISFTTEDDELGSLEVDRAD